MRHKNYHTRLVDQTLRARLASAGAVLLRGAKGCGKTFTAQQLSASELFVDTDTRAQSLIDVDPALLLRGDTPRLLDEWQIYPDLWNYVRREIDNRQMKGQFILTGSANPVTDAKIHSGVGRFAVLKMQTMSRAELGQSNAQVPLEELLNPHSDLRFADMDERSYPIDEVVRQIVFGGFPALLGATLNDALRFAQDYVALTAEADISRADGVKRDPAKVLRLIRSYARNIATQAAVTAIAKDVRGGDASFTETTAFSYIDALEKLMFIDNLSAWNTHLRSSVALRTTPKRHFCDPSLAIGALKLSVDDLLRDMEFTGFLFESSVIRDLRVYADTIGAEVSFYRDAKEREVDAIVRKNDGSWAGFEIKLGNSRIDEGAKSLLALHSVLDYERIKKPSSLNVITASGFAYRRPDGVNVIPISVLGAV